MIINGEFGVSNIATIIVYLLSIVKSFTAFLTISKSSKALFGISILLHPFDVMKALKTSIVAIKEILKAIPDAWKEVGDLSMEELKSLVKLVIIGLQRVSNE